MPMRFRMASPLLAAAIRCLGVLARALVWAPDGA